MTRLLAGEPVQRSAASDRGTGPLSDELAAAIQAERGGGDVLPGAVQADMGPRLGADFSAVRVHSGATSAAFNRSLDAEAFTTGTDIFLRNDSVDPGSGAGRELLAHELTHVVQQTAANPGGPARVSRPDEPAEVQARRVGRAVAAGTPLSLVPEFGRLAGNAAVARQLSADGTTGPVTAADPTSVRTVARQDASPAPRTPAASLTNQQLLDEIRALDRTSSSPESGADVESRHRELMQERDRRITAGHIWLADAGSSDFLQAAGGDAGARIEATAVDPRPATGSSVTPIFTRGQLERGLRRNGVPTMEMSSADFASTAPAAGAVPGPSISPQVLGRFYPFLRPMAPFERAMVAETGAVHYTQAANLPDIAQPNGGVDLWPSTGYRNLTDPGARQSSYFFGGEPSAGQYRTNLAGGPAKAEQAVIFVEGADLPPGTLFRPIDNVLSVPGGYRGPAQVVAPGQPVPSGNGVALPVPGGSASAAEQLRTQGSFSGHPLAAGAGAGVIAIVLETGVVLVNTGDLPSAQQLAGTGAAGTAGGVAGAVTEQVASRALAQTALGQGTSRVFVILGRGGAGALGGFIAAPVVEMGRMALDPDHDYTGTDYAARGTRSAVAGGLSGALAAGATAAAAGSVAPGVGTAIGFVVGVGAYLIIDWAIGDAVEGGVRAAAR
jgi:hypothetical protein